MNPPIKMRLRAKYIIPGETISTILLYSRTFRPWSLSKAASTTGRVFLGEWSLDMNSIGIPVQLCEKYQVSVFCCQEPGLNGWMRDDASMLCERQTALRGSAITGWTVYIGRFTLHWMVYSFEKLPRTRMTWNFPGCERKHAMIGILCP